MKTIHPSLHLTPTSIRSLFPRSWQRKGLAWCALAALCSFSLASHAETTSASGAKAITSLPYTISTPGTYYFSQDLSLATNTIAITITTPNVTLDFNGHTLSNTSTSLVTAQAINETRTSTGPTITIRNGRIVNFGYGVVSISVGVQTGFSSLIEDMSFVGMYYGAVSLQGPMSRIVRCQSYQCGGNHFLVNGTGSSVEDCQSSGRNPNNSNPVTGIYAGNNNCFVVNNRIDSVDTGINGTSTFKYRDNITTNVTTPYSGGTNLGNNN